MNSTYKQKIVGELCQCRSQLVEMHWLEEVKNDLDFKHDVWAAEQAIRKVLERLDEKQPGGNKQ